MIVVVIVLMINLGFKTISADQQTAGKFDTEEAAGKQSAIKSTAEIGTLATEQLKIVDNPQRIPILMYHYIRDYQVESDPLGSGLSVSPAIFEQQIKTLVDSGYQTITLDQYLTNNFQGQVFIVTFDDGYQDAYLGFKILKKYSQKGVFYVISDRIDQPGYLSSSQIKEISDWGMVIGGHTKSHPDLVKHAENYPDSLSSELVESQQKIKEIIQKEVIDFCYPAGSYNDLVISALRNSGYHSAVTTQKNPENFDRMSIPRVRMTNFSGEALLNIAKKYYE